MKIITKTKEETLALGNSLAKKFKGGEIISLVGELGSGKTALSQGIAQGLGIKKNITSPTFVILNIYNVKNHPKKIKKLVHIDAYRLENEIDLENIGFFDFIQEKENIIIIEWGDKIKKYLPKKTKTIKLKSLEENSREIKFI